MYPEFVEAMVQGNGPLYGSLTEQGIDWQPYEVLTDDGWTLTIFRLYKTGQEGVKQYPLYV